LTGACIDDRTGPEEPSRNPGKVIPYEEFLRAREAREALRRVDAQDGEGADTSGIDDSTPPPSEFDHSGFNPPESEGHAAGGEARSHTVGEIRARIRDGFYDRPEILEETVQRILSSLDVRKESQDGSEMKW
jgi:hypothetical protein